MHAIRSCYGNAPYFIHYYDEIKELLDKKNDYLIELNIDIIQWIIGILGLDIKISITDKFHKHDLEKFDLRNQITPKSNQTSIEMDFKNYPQVFAEKFSFIQNLSILDLLFNFGPEATLYLKSIIHE